LFAIDFFRWFEFREKSDQNPAQAFLSSGYQFLFTLLNEEI